MTRWIVAFVLWLIVLVALSGVADWTVKYLIAVEACNTAGGVLKTEHLGIKPVCVIYEGKGFV